MAEIAEAAAEIVGRAAGVIAADRAEAAADLAAVTAGLAAVEIAGIAAAGAVDIPSIGRTERMSMLPKRRYPTFHPRRKP
jgi:hypothetical protein